VAFWRWVKEHGSESQPYLHNGRFQDCDLDCDERHRLRQREPDGHSREGGANGLVHVQPDVPCGGAVGAVHGLIDRNADVVVVELWGRIYVDPEEPDTRLHDGGIENGNPDGDQCLGLQQHEPHDNGCGSGLSRVVHVQSDVSYREPIGTVHGYIDRKPDILVMGLQRRIDQHRSKPEPCFFLLGDIQCYANRSQWLRFDQCYSGPERFAVFHTQRIVHLQPCFPKAFPVGAVYGHVDRDADLVVLEFWRRIH